MRRPYFRRGSEKPAPDHETDPHPQSKHKEKQGGLVHTFIIPGARPSRDLTRYSGKSFDAASSVITKPFVPLNSNALGPTR